MNDLISRETAIQTVHETMYQFIDGNGTMTNSDFFLLKVNKAICNGLKEIPSVENKGEWIEWKGRNGRYKGIPICSNCNTGFPIVAKGYKFCPECGAKMKGGE